MSEIKHDIDYFLQNEAFVSWVKEPDQGSNLFWREWLHSHPENKDTFLQAKEIILAMKFDVGEPADADFNEVLQNVLKGQPSANSDVASMRSSRQISWVFKVAAAVALLVLTTYVLYFNESQRTTKLLTENPISKENPYGRKSKLSLSDGSTATLNAGSSLRYLRKFDENLREVELNGEAFFEVEKDPSRPFVVRLGKLSATVLGTSFNITSFKEEDLSSIALKTGKLKVEVPGSSGGKENYILVPGQKLIYNRNLNEVSIVTMSTQDMGLWTQGILAFDQDNFETIEKKLERWFGVEINHQGLEIDNIKFSTRYKQETLNNVLMSMGFALNFEYEIKDKLIEIKFKKEKI